MRCSKLKATPHPPRDIPLRGNRRGPPSPAGEGFLYAVNKDSPRQIFIVCRGYLLKVILKIIQDKLFGL